MDDSHTYLNGAPAYPYRTQTYPSTTVTLPSYSLLNLTSSYSLDKHFSPNARVDNPFKRNYSEVYSCNTLGRTLFVGLSYR